MIEIRNLKHTPGPWLPVRFDFGKLSFWTVISKDGRLPEKGEDGKANAHLHAAAPDLLEAAHECLKAEMERRKMLKPGAPATTYCEARIAKISAAIAKVEGSS